MRIQLYISSEKADALMEKYGVNTVSEMKEQAKEEMENALMDGCPGGDGA